MNADFGATQAREEPFSLIGAGTFLVIDTLYREVGCQLILMGFFVSMVGGSVLDVGSHQLDAFGL